MGRLVLLLLFPLLLIGCAAKTVQLKPLPSTSSVSTDQARITVKRESIYFADAIALDVLDNGVKVAEIGPGGLVSWDRDSGLMKLTVVDTSWNRSFNEIDIMVGEGRKYEFSISYTGVETAERRVSHVSGTPTQVISRAGTSINTTKENKVRTANNIKPSLQPMPPEPQGAALNIDFLKTSSVSPSSIAVIIGNKNYTHGVPDVEYAHNDADLIKRYVLESLGYREGNIIDLRDATQADLVSVFGNEKSYKAKLFNWLRSGESDVFVYYSGHGAPSLSAGQGYLLPVNADPSTVEFNGYPLETLYSNLGNLPAKNLTIVIDACFSGSSQAGAVIKNASSISLKRVEAKTTIPNATIFSAAGLSEVASWDEQARLGLFTGYFLKGVSGDADEGNFGDGDGSVTVGELKTFLESEVTYMARRLYNRDQHPQVSGQPEKVLAAAD